MSDSHVAALLFGAVSARAHAAGGHGVAFWIIGGVLVVALAISLWRLRRRTSGPET